MSTTLKNLSVANAVSQQVPATQSQHLVRKGEFDGALDGKQNIGKVVVQADDGKMVRLGVKVVNGTYVTYLADDL